MSVPTPATAAATTPHPYPIPEPGIYDIDATHSAVTFTVRHLGLSKVRGSFERFGGRLVVAEVPTASHVAVAIESASFTTHNDDRDAHVRSSEFLDVEAHPELRFASTGIRHDGDAWIVDGELTIKGVTRTVELAVTFDGSGTDPWGGRRIAFSASTEIDREDFGITWNQALEAGGVLVGRKVRIAIDVQAVAA